LFDARGKKKTNIYVEKEQKKRKDGSEKL